MNTESRADAGFWRALLLVALIEAGYALLSRVVIGAYLQGGALELATTALRMVTIAFYGSLFPDLIRSREPATDVLKEPMLLTAAAVSLLNPLLFGNDAWPAWTDKLIYALTSFVVGPREEIAYRAVLQNTLERRLGWPVAVMLASLMFALYHYGYGGIAFTPRRFAELYLAGVAFGMLYRCSGSLLLVSGLHALLDVLWSLSPWLATPLPAPGRMWMDVMAVALLMVWSYRARRTPT